MRTTHRRTWQRERWLIVDERTGATHYADEMVVEPTTGLVVHRDSVDRKHPQLRVRPKYKDPAPVTPTIPAPSTADPLGINYANDITNLIGNTGIQDCVPAAAEDIFGTGVNKMVIEGCDPFARFTVDAKDTIYSRTFGPTVFP